jgi:hypothetical protein
MLKKRVLVVFLSCLLVFLISLLVSDTDKPVKTFTRMISLTTDKLSSGLIDNEIKVVEVNTSKQTVDKEEFDSQAKEQPQEQNTNTNENTSETKEEEIATEEPAPATPPIVYDGLTLDELASKLERSMKNELSGKGYLYASYSLEKGVDPYLALAISLEETGCNWNCSNLVKSCNNVGGMIGSGCGGFSAWPTLDDGIRAFIDNIARNYVAYGLTTAETMNPKYAENPAWAANVNRYISSIQSK